jgi:hypothetical protein
VEFWGETDLYGLMRQLGKVPAEIAFDDLPASQQGH